MEKQETESIEDVIFNYDIELSRYIDKFFLTFGFSPDEPNLQGKRKRLAQVFWDSKEVSKLQGLMEAYCVLLGAS